MHVQAFVGVQTLCVIYASHKVLHCVLVWADEMCMNMSRCCIGLTRPLNKTIFEMLYYNSGNSSSPSVLCYKIMKMTA